MNTDQWIYLKYYNKQICYRTKAETVIPLEAISIFSVSSYRFPNG